MPSLFLILGKDRTNNNFRKLSNLSWVYTFFIQLVQFIQRIPGLSNVLPCVDPEGGGAPSPWKMTNL